jgi:hypothetical protein
MPSGPAVKRPLQTVLAELALEKRGLVLVQGRRYFRIEDQASQARREAKSGPLETRRFLQAHDFWWDEDPDGLVVVYQETPGGPKPLAAEIGSRFTPLALDEGDWGPEMILSGSLGRIVGCTGSEFENRCYDVGRTYGFDQLPSKTRRDAIAQTDDFTAHFGHRPDVMQYRFLVIPHDEVMKVLFGHFGAALEDAMKAPKVKRLSRSIRDEGLKYPPIADEGWQRTLAMASLGLDLPYFEVLPPLDAQFEPMIPTLEGVRWPSGR